MVSRSFFWLMAIPLMGFGAHIYHLEDPVQYEGRFWQKVRFEEGAEHLTVWMPGAPVSGLCGVWSVESLLEEEGGKSLYYLRTPFARHPFPATKEEGIQAVQRLLTQELVLERIAFVDTKDPQFLYVIEWSGRQGEWVAFGRFFVTKRRIYHLFTLMEKMNKDVMKDFLRSAH